MNAGLSSSLGQGSLARGGRLPWHAMRGMQREWWHGFFDATYVEWWREAGAFDDSDDLAAGVAALLDLPPGARLLDVPCGFGRVSGRLQAMGFDVVGVDASSYQVALARRAGGGARCVVGDMRALPVRLGSFDGVLNLYTSFGYFADPDDDRAALRAWHAALRPDGVLVMDVTTRERVAAVVAARESGEEPFAWAPGEFEHRVDWVGGMVRQMMRKDGVEKVFELRMYTASELVGLVRDAGFRRVEAYGGMDRRPVSPLSRLVLRAQR